MLFFPQEHTLFKNSISPQSLATIATTNGTGFSFVGYEYVAGIFNFGAIAGAQAGVVKLEQSVDNSTFAAITGATYTYGVGDADKIIPIIIKKSPFSIYIRAVWSRTTTDAALLSAQLHGYAPASGVIVNSPVVIYVSS